MALWFSINRFSKRCTANEPSKTSPLRTWPAGQVCSTLQYQCTFGHSSCHLAFCAAQIQVSDISWFSTGACKICVGKATWGTPLLFIIKEPYNDHMIYHGFQQEPVSLVEEFSIFTAGFQQNTYLLINKYY
ncbi:unnamed protein product [Cuscuta europaea]|uniref:Uncharacterized protein n=1 Tax=Cuscuta europaea TaxID=41803 RepID=A0A9P0ZB71_CUSEU|nr:unnamed protein product [Cuscuta europaea]